LFIGYIRYLTAQNLYAYFKTAELSWPLPNTNQPLHSTSHQSNDKNITRTIETVLPAFELRRLISSLSMEHHPVRMPEAIRVAKLQVAEDGGIPSSVAGKSRFFQPVSGFRSTHQPGVWSSRVSSTSAYLNELCNALFIQALSIYSFAQSQLRKRAGAATNLAGLAGFAIACVALWSTLSSMHDTRQALALAQWTARKDFLQYCHSVRETSSSHSTVQTI
jgi:hypothetical protein